MKNIPSNAEGPAFPPPSIKLLSPFPTNSSPVAGHDDAATLGNTTRAPDESYALRSTRTPPVIDHKFFPDIIDLILDANDIWEYNNWRGTSKAFRDRIDARTAAYVSLGKPEDSRYAVTSFGLASDFPLGGERRVPGCMKHLAPHVRILDLQNHCWAEHINKETLFSNVHTVRYMPRRPHKYKWRYLTHEAPKISSGAYTRLVVFAIPGFEGNGPEGQYHVGAQVKRLVINTHVDIDFRHIRLYGKGNPEEMVVVLNSCPEPPRLSKDERVAYLMDSLCHLLCFGPQATHVVVNLPDDISPAEVREQLGMVYRFGGYGPFDGRTWADGIIFRTEEEQRRAIGPEQYAIETSRHLCITDCNKLARNQAPWNCPTTLMDALPAGDYRLRRPYESPSDDSDTDATSDVDSPSE